MIAIAIAIAIKHVVWYSVINSYNYHVAGFDFFSNFFLYCNILISFRMRIAIYSIGTIRYKVLWILFVSLILPIPYWALNRIACTLITPKLNLLAAQIILCLPDIGPIFFFLSVSGCVIICDEDELMKPLRNAPYRTYKMEKKEREKNSTKKRRNKEILIIFFIQRENMVAIRQTVDIELSWLLIAFYMSTSNDIGSRKTEWSGASVAFIAFASGKKAWQTLNGRS